MLRQFVDTKLPPEKLDVQIISAGDCSQTASDDVFVTIHFRSYFEDGTSISST